MAGKSSDERYEAVGYLLVGAKVDLERAIEAIDRISPKGISFVNKREFSNAIKRCESAIKKLKSSFAKLEINVG